MLPLSDCCGAVANDRSVHDLLAQMIQGGYHAGRKLLLLLVSMLMARKRHSLRTLNIDRMLSFSSP